MPTRFDAAVASQPLRPYQQQVVSALVSALGGGKPRRVAIQMPTGSGKTRTTSDYVVLERLAKGERVLWVTKDWWLLGQAVQDFCRRHRGIAARIGRVGGEAELPGIEENASADLVFTSIHTWDARAASLSRQQFDLVVIDEQHWGEDGPMYSRLERAYGRRAQLLGMTATPRAWSEYELVAQVSFEDLVRQGYLARPLLEAPHRTGVRWSPELTGRNGDFSPTSLASLARSRRRNELIVRTWLEHRDRYGKTVIFACNIDHAMALTRALRAAGVSADALHCQLAPADQRDVMNRFARPTGQGGFRTDVLVNVAKATHGVDVPDIRTVFLARPTASDILFVQMAGRGARIAPGKREFHLVDFVDTLDAHAEKLLRPSQFYGAGGGVKDAAPRPRPARAAGRDTYAYEPAPIQVFVPGHGLEQLDGLEFQPGQDFGVEFELTRDGFDGNMPDDWRPIARELLAAVKSEVGEERAAWKALAEHHDEDKDHRRWNVEWDASCGWEVTSRVLRGAEGIRELHDTAKAIDAAAARLGLKVNARTGTHVHLAWGRPTLERLRRLYGWVAAIEPALYSLVAPSRWGNQYCAPIRRAWPELARLRSLGGWERWFTEEGARYVTVNAANLFGGIGTVEVRLHSGTLSGPKILTWLSLWMRVLEAVDRGLGPPDEVGSVRRLPLARGLEGDIVRVALQLGAGIGLRRALDARRRHLTTRWQEHDVHGERAAEVAQAWGAPLQVVEDAA